MMEGIKVQFVVFSAVLALTSALNADAHRNDVPAQQEASVTESLTDLLSAVDQARSEDVEKHFAALVAAVQREGIAEELQSELQALSVMLGTESTAKPSDVTAFAAKFAEHVSSIQRYADIRQKLIKYGIPAAVVLASGVCCWYAASHENTVFTRLGNNAVVVYNMLTGHLVSFYNRVSGWGFSSNGGPGDTSGQETTNDPVQGMNKSEKTDDGGSAPSQGEQPEEANPWNLGEQFS